MIGTLISGGLQIYAQGFYLRSGSATFFGTMRLNRNQYGQRQGPRQQGQGRGGQAPNQQMPIPNQPQIGHNLPPPVNFYQPVPVNMRNRVPRGRHMGARHVHWE